MLMLQLEKNMRLIKTPQGLFQITRLEPPKFSLSEDEIANRRLTENAPNIVYFLKTHYGS